MRSAFTSVLPVLARTICLISALTLATTVTAGDRVLVFAAASTVEAVEALAGSFRRETGVTVTVSAAGSGTLARQIEAGAPADIFLSANPGWMDYLQKKGLIVVESRRNMLANTLVVVGAPGALEYADVEQLLAKGRFAMGDPGHVPAGIYARQAMESFGLWPALAVRAVLTENVRVALALVARGEVAHAIVYGSDALAEPGAAVVFRFPAHSHAPIVYPAALTAQASENARFFLDYLTHAAGSGFFAEYGFVTVPESG